MIESKKDLAAQVIDKLNALNVGRMQGVVSAELGDELTLFLVKYSDKITPLLNVKAETFFSIFVTGYLVRANEEHNLFSSKASS